MISRPALAAFGVALLSMAPAAQTPARPQTISPPPSIGFYRSPLPPSGGVVLGQVVDVATGHGVSNALVRLSGGDGPQTCLADDLGRFYFVGLPGGNFTITASKRGFIDGAYGKHRADGTAVALTLGDRQWAAGLRVEMFRTAVISGAVVDEVNEPLVGVRVRAWRREFVEGRPQLVDAGDDLTDDEGIYRIYGLRPGDYVLGVPAVQVTMPVETFERIRSSASASSAAASLLDANRVSSIDDHLVQPGGRLALLTGRSPMPPPPGEMGSYVYATQFFPSFELPSQALPVTVGPGEVLAGTHFQMRLLPTHTVAGIVVGPEGPAAGQLVRLLLAGIDVDGPNLETASTITDDDGAFTLLNIPNGDYVAEVQPAGSSTKDAIRLTGVGDIQVFAPSGAGPWGRTNLSVRDADTPDVIVALRPGASVGAHVLTEGRVRADQLARVSVRLVPADHSISRSIALEADASARFFVGHPIPGFYFVRVDTGDSGLSVKAVTGHGQDLLDAPLRVEGDVAFTFTLTSRPAMVTGTVRSPTGMPVPGATVLVLPGVISETPTLNPNRLRELRAATSGVFTVADLPPGEYLFVAVDDATAAGWLDPRRAAVLQRQGLRVSIRPSENKVIDLTLRR